MKKNSKNKKKGGEINNNLTTITPDYMKKSDDYYSDNLKTLHQEKIKVTTIIPDYMKKLDIYRHKLKTLHQEEIKEINLNNIKDKIPDNIKYAIISAFENYKLTNNGVIFWDSNNLIKKAGATLNNNLTDRNVIENLQTYCIDVIRRSSDDNIDIYNFLFSIPQNTILNNYNYLKDFINSNNTHHSNTIFFSYNPKYEYQNVKSAIDIENDNRVQKEYHYREYNKDIVEAYEKNFFEDRNINAIQNFIKKQMDYLKTLNNIEKKIIQDYTKPESFNFYKLSISNEPSDNREFNTYRKNFGDSFYHQIHTLQTAGRISIVLGETQINSIAEPTRLPVNGMSIIQLTNREWRLVLNQFMIDLNEIVLKAPPVEEVIYCYRGVSAQYITGGRLEQQNLLELINGKPKVRSFISNRLGSFSVDFNISKQFYDDLQDTQYETSRCLYRTAIMPGCRILYVAPLSLLSYELEFISPINSKFLYNIDQQTETDLSPKLSNNNINREYGICSREDEQFKSFDIVLAFTPQPANAFEVIKNALGGIGENAINGYLEVCGCRPTFS